MPDAREWCRGDVVQVALMRCGISVRSREYVLSYLIEECVHQTNAKAVLRTRHWGLLRVCEACGKNDPLAKRYTLSPSAGESVVFA